MKKWMSMLLLVAIACVSVGAGESAAAGKTEATIDASLLYATEPLGGYDSTVGIGVGALIDLSNSMKMSQKDMKLGLRADVAYFEWDGNFYGIGVSYTSLAFFGGPRLSFGKIGGGAPVVPYVEGGLELVFSEAEVVVPGFGKSSVSDTSLGFAGGGGIDFILAPNLKLGVNGRLHLVDDDFLTLGVTLGMMF